MNSFEQRQMVASMQKPISKINPPTLLPSPTPQHIAVWIKEIESFVRIWNPADFLDAEKKEDTIRQIVAGVYGNVKDRNLQLNLESEYPDYNTLLAVSPDSAAPNQTAAFPGWKVTTITQFTIQYLKGLSSLINFVENLVSPVSIHTLLQALNQQEKCQCTGLQDYTNWKQRRAAMDTQVNRLRNRLGLQDESKWQDLRQALLFLSQSGVRGADLSELCRSLDQDILKLTITTVSTALDLLCTRQRVLERPTPVNSLLDEYQDTTSNQLDDNIAALCEHLDDTDLGSNIIAAIRKSKASKKTKKDFHVSSITPEEALKSGKCMHCKGLHKVQNCPSASPDQKSLHLQAMRKHLVERRKNIASLNMILDDDITEHCDEQHISVNQFCNENVISSIELSDTNDCPRTTLCPVLPSDQHDIDLLGDIEILQYLPLLNESSDPAFFDKICSIRSWMVTFNFTTFSDLPKDPHGIPVVLSILKDRSFIPNLDRHLFAKYIACVQPQLLWEEEFLDLWFAAPRSLCDFGKYHDKHPSFVYVTDPAYCRILRDSPPESQAEARFSLAINRFEDRMRLNFSLFDEDSKTVSDFSVEPHSERIFNLEFQLKELLEGFHISEANSFLRENIVIQRSRVSPVIAPVVPKCLDISLDFETDSLVDDISEVNLDKTMITCTSPSPSRPDNNCDQTKSFSTISSVTPGNDICHLCTDSVAEDDAWIHLDCGAVKTVSGSKSARALGKALAKATSSPFRVEGHDPVGYSAVGGLKLESTSAVCLPLKGGGQLDLDILDGHSQQAPLLGKPSMKQLGFVNDWRHDRLLCLDSPDTQIEEQEDGRIAIIGKWIKTRDQPNGHSAVNLTDLHTNAVCAVTPDRVTERTVSTRSTPSPLAMPQTPVTPINNNPQSIIVGLFDGYNGSIHVLHIIDVDTGYSWCEILRFLPNKPLNVSDDASDVIPDVLVEWLKQRTQLPETIVIDFHAVPERAFRRIKRKLFYAFRSDHNDINLLHSPTFLWMAQHTSFIQASIRKLSNTMPASTFALEQTLEWACSLKNSSDFKPSGVCSQQVKNLTSSLFH